VRGAEAAPSASDADAGPTTTTTTTLANNGDLQGAKLQSSSQTTVETSTSGPKPHGGSEPGRRVQDIQTIVQGRRDDARKCYDDALKKHPGIEGDLDIKWTIDPKGVVTEIAVDDAKSQIHEPEVSDCIIAIIKKIKFNESAKGFETRAHYPFNFHPHGAAKPSGSGSGSGSTGSPQH